VSAAIAWLRFASPGQQIERHQRDRHEEPGKRQNNADHEDAAHHVAEQPHQQRKGPREALDEIEWDHDWVGRSEGREIAAYAARADAEPDHRSEHQQRERGIGFEMGCRRFDPRNQRGPVGDEDECEQATNKGAIRGVFDSHGVVDLAVYCIDDQFEGRLGRRRDERQSTGDEKCAKDQHSHDRPSGDHACGDWNRTEMEENHAGKRRSHGTASRALCRTAERATRMPSAIISRGSAPSRLANASKPPKRTKRPITKAIAIVARPPKAKKWAFHQTAWK
jgi:hypothetical protein